MLYHMEAKESKDGERGKQPLMQSMSLSLQMREREVKLWDTRKFSGATFTLALDTSSG